MAISFAHKFMPFLLGSGILTGVKAPFTQQAGPDVLPAPLLQVDFRGASQSSDEGLDTLDLMPGNMSFRQKILNIVRQGNPARAIELIQRAFDRVSDMSQTDHVTKIAHEAMDAMEAKGYKDEAKQMAEVLVHDGATARNRLNAMPVLAVA